MPDTNASEIRMPFGKYRNCTLGDIADADLLYLDWLNDPERNIRDNRLKLAIAQICAERAQEIDALLDQRGDD